MTTIHNMAKPPNDKTEVTVNAFKAPEEWYRMIKQISAERRSTIGGAIQHLVEIAMPIYQAMHAAEQEVKRHKTDEVLKGLKKRAV